ncbi:AAA ATPase domain-containing protein [Cryptosporangium aurantiacum]|uniref:AAA ATPase domain-containing protein n=1 Tax=Cryptosporangium aurantiacum TaxID=134849 RepID=A0A1M7REK3_9ACTN|nr:AAA ATPase domain-containing protein [Cryptosporangium aurantiacum]
MASVAAGGSAGFIVGEAGVGKTALLRWVAQHGDSRVVWIRGAEYESVLPFACAADLLTPLRPHFAGLPAVQRRALETALALTDGPMPTSLAICAAALGALAAACDQEPLVVLVDDLQWIDPESRQLMLFVARRIVTERICIIFALRDQPGIAPPPHDLPLLHLTGLTLAECTDLARRRGLAVPERIMREVVESTGGNPLAVLETLTHRPEAATASGTRPITVGTSVEQAWRPVLDRLPEETRRALFVLAVGRLPGLPGVADLLTAMGLSIHDLEPAESQGLVRASEEGLELRHPLLRQVLIDATAVGVRLRTYRALADLGGPEQRVWYLSYTAADLILRALDVLGAHGSERNRQESAQLGTGWLAPSGTTTAPRC